MVQTTPEFLDPTERKKFGTAGRADAGAARLEARDRPALSMEGLLGSLLSEEVFESDLGLLLRLALARVPSFIEAGTPTKSACRTALGAGKSPRCNGVAWYRHNIARVADRFCADLKPAFILKWPFKRRSSWSMTGTTRVYSSYKTWIWHGL